MDNTTVATTLTEDDFIILMENVNNRPLEFTREEAKQLRRGLMHANRSIEKALVILDAKLGIDKK